MPIETARDAHARALDELHNAAEEFERLKLEYRRIQNQLPGAEKRFHQALAERAKALNELSRQEKNSQ